MNFDTIISGGTVINGTGTPGVLTDLGISGKEIAATGDLSESTADYRESTGFDLLRMRD